MNPGGQGSLLAECRNTSATRLREVVAGGLEHLKPELLRIIDMAMGPEVYYLYMGALELLRDNPGRIEAAFHKAYLRRFDQVQRDGRLPSASVPGASQLSLLAADDLEESLATDSLANAIADGCVEELFGLDKRIGLLINDPDLLQSDNPLGPEVIARAMMDALEGFNADIKSRLLVMTQLSKLMPEGVRDLYRDLNQMLIQRKVLPTIRVGLRRGGQSAAPMPAAPPERSPVGHTEETAEAPHFQGDLFAMFQQFVNGMAGGVGAGGGGGSLNPAGRPAGYAGAAGMGFGMPSGVRAATVAPLESEELLRSLNQLQRGQPAALGWAGLDEETFSDGRINVLHGLRAGLMARANSIDAMTLDIVAMVFDYILDDTRIPDAMKALIGRLQIPVLKVAMVDKSFFSRKAHPARKLLDRLAEAGITMDPASIHETELYHRSEALVDRIIDQFDERLEIFAEVLGELDAYMAGEQRQAEVALVDGIEVVRAKEAADLSHQVAHAVVQETLIGHHIPLAIRDFIVRHWQRLLADIHQKHGSDGTAWKIAVSTMANLVWSVEPKYDPTERANLVALIPSLLKELNMGADSIGVPPEDRELFFATLVPCHTLALKSVVLEDDMLAQPVRVEATATPMAESHDFEPVRPFLAKAETGRSPAKAAARTVTKSVPTSGKSDIEGLSLGGWIEHTRDDGGVAILRLAWVSPLKGIYMFTNRAGDSVMSITTRGLQAKMRTGEVRVIDDAPLMDRVVDNLMEHFQSRVG